MQTVGSIPFYMNTKTPLDSCHCKCKCKKNVNVIYLPTKHQRARGNCSKVSVLSRSNWNLEMLVFVAAGKPENTVKNPRSNDENQQQTQSTFNAEAGNRTRPTLMGGKCSQHRCAMPTPLLSFVFVIKRNHKRTFN